jgi:hypothetical protein
MIKLFLSSIILLFASNILASTTAHFVYTGEQVVITMSSQSLIGGYDEGPRKLFNDLNMPAEKSFIGEGKVLKDSEGAMTLIVADRGNGRYDGSIVLKRGPNIEINPMRKYAVVKFTGPIAQYLFSKWYSQNSQYEYSSKEGNLKIFADPEIFLLRFL